MARDMPRAFRLLGFTESDWESWQEIKSTLGSVPELVETMRAYRESYEQVSMQIAVMNQILFQLHPAEYNKAMKALGLQGGKVK